MHSVILLAASFESLINFDFPKDNTKTNFKLGQIKTIVFLIRKILLYHVFGFVEVKALVTATNFDVCYVFEYILKLARQTVPQ